MTTNRISPNLDISCQNLGGWNTSIYGTFDLTGDEDLTDEDGDIRMGNSTGVSASLGGKIFSGRKKSRESNIGDSDNTTDGGKITGEIDSEDKRSLVKSSKELGEVFPGEARE
ncbi:hypothetical protein Tco_0804303 [Tanacetum coccineum]|uniref:Uncharacterized protein n=1 Tax=Tanacetum coccineum TaxID=301880 RepID=A0ABQ5A3X6_9ASTR